MIKYYLVVFLTFSLISVGILLLKNPFFIFAEATANLLNSVLKSNKDESLKPKQVSQKLGNMLLKLGALLFLIAMTLGVSFIPVVVYLEYNPEKSIQDLDVRSIYFFLSVILGSVALFVAPWANQSRERDYSGWSMLLHRMILGNYNISSALFRLEKKLYRAKINVPAKDFVIVTGLARGGATSMTNLLFESKAFHSLSFDDMPFLLSVNLWRKLHLHRKKKLKHSKAGELTIFGYNNIEMLEEYFFKVFLNDAFIKSNNLQEHEIDRKTYEDYISYQKLIGLESRESTYLAKNNNLILRLKSLRMHNPDFKVVLMFRNPVAHGFSLMIQHDRCCDMHEADPFSLEYMNWLGDYEFGLNHKVFDFEMRELCDRYEHSSINYWIAIWISYYTQVLSLVEDKNLFLIDYSDLCSKPQELISALGEILNLSLSVDQRIPYIEKELSDLDLDPELVQKSEWIYQELRNRMIEIK